MRTVILRTPDLNPNLLHDALLERYPNWRGTPTPRGWQDPLVRLEFDDTEIRIDHPDADLSSMIEAARGKVRPKAKREEAEAILRELRKKVKRNDLDAEALQNALIDYLLS